MIFQSMPLDNSTIVAEALTAAEIAKQQLAAIQEQLELANAELADADAALAILGVTVDE